MKRSDSMFTYILKNLIYYWRTVLSIVLILLIMGVSFTYTLQTTERMKIATNEELDDQWRTEYDLLISPNPEQDSSATVQAEKSDHPGIEGEKTLVRRSDMGNHYGGITLEQYEKIKMIEGVKVAAPISFLGYISAKGVDISFPTDGYGFYLSDDRTQVFDGIRYRSMEDENDKNRLQDNAVIEYMSEERMNEINKDLQKYWDQGWVPTTYSKIGTQLRSGEYFWSLIAIDPEEEKKLLGINEAIIEGKYLPQEDQLSSEMGVPKIPVILSNRTYDVKKSYKVEKIATDENLSSEQIFELGGREYLLSLPRKEIAQVELNPYSEEYLYYYGELTYENGTLVKNAPPDFSWSSMSVVAQMGPIQYQYRGELDGNPLYIANPIRKTGEFIHYRNINFNHLEREFGFDVYGKFDPSLLRSLHATNKNPKAPDYYNPEKVYYTHDVKQKAYDKRIEYQPAPFKTGYYTGGVDAITTLKAAEFFLGDKPISIIRVIVDGVGKRTQESMNKVERVAQQIRKETGLRVDVMLGAADRKVQILLDDYEGAPGYGYLLEGWSQPGASFQIEHHVSGTNLMLGSFILVMGTIGLVLIYRNYAESRRKDLTILYTNGWTKGKIYITLFIETCVVFIAITTVLFLLKLTPGLSWGNRQFIISYLMVIGISIIAVLFAYILPMIRKIGNRLNLKGSGEVIIYVFAKRPVQSFISYLLISLIRYPARTVIKFFILFSTVVYLYLFLLAKGSSSKFLMVTFLGENIELMLEPYQWFLLAVGILLAIGSYFSVQVNQMEKRTREIQLYTAWGWKRSKWIWLFILEEILISFTAIISGCGVGILILTSVQQTEIVHSYFILLLTAVTVILTILLLMIPLISRPQQNRLREFN
jgi:putative ABC transport system permease protein